MPPTPRNAADRRPSSSSKSRPCELCYRPMTGDEERFCAKCKPKAKKHGRI